MDFDEKLETLGKSMANKTSYRFTQCERPRLKRMRLRLSIPITAILAVILVPVIVLTTISSTGTSPVNAADLMSGIKPNPVSTDIDISNANLAAIDFAVRLFQQSVSAKENILISPLSVLCALAMTANGADGNTLAQMETIFGVSMAELNAYLYSYINNLSSENKCEFILANSIWFRDDDSLAVKKAFLQLNADYYGASIYKASFDANTLKAINNWVSKNTKDMIDKILDSISADAVMYLINALSFDAEWQSIYPENYVRSGTFTAKSGKIQAVEMMHSTEGVYLDDGFATGFVKYYSGGKYAFVALLPNDNISINEYILTLSGEKLATTIKNAQNVPVSTAMPKFESEYSIVMADILKDMGMSDAFDESLANFSRLGHSDYGNLFISRVIHKTFISVDERGTKAGAVTAIEINVMGAGGPTPKTVHLDRPFVYMIIDCETNLPVFVPLFIGAVLDI